MSLVHRVGMVVTIALVVTSGRIPTARAMTLPDLRGRQETAVVSAVATSAVSASIDPAVSMSSLAISSSIIPFSAAAPTSSAVASTAPATSSAVPISSASSLAVSTSSAAALSTDPSLSVSAASISPSISASISSTLNATSTSSANSTLAQELESPLPKPHYAPGGMAFILPAFVVIGLIFIIWLIHKTKEYIWKLKEAEEAADTQSPNPGSGPLGAVPKPAPKVGGAEKPPGSGLGGKWKKKGWKELDSDSEGEHVYRRTTSDKYSRVGEWQGSRKYRSRDGRHPRNRDDGHREGGDRGRYGRLDAHDDERHYAEPVPERRSSHREERRRESDHSRDRPRSRNEGGRPHSPAPSHVSRALSKKEKKERAAEWINDERHHVSERRESGGHGHDARRGGKGKEREVYAEYERGHVTGQHFSLMPPQEGQRKIAEPQLEVQIGAPAVTPAPAPPAQPLQRTKTQRKSAAPPSAPAPPPETPTHEDVPAYMRARAASPPPILSPPLHPNLFFHNGPSMTQLVPLSTYDSGTDLESMISAQPSPLPDAHSSRMPDVPSTAEKLERSATSGPGRTTRKAQTPSNSRLVARTPTRTKSHDPSVAPGTPSAVGSRADVLRTPTRRGTDGVKTTGRATPTIRLIESRGGSIRGGQTPDLSKASGITPKKYSKRVAPAPTPSSTPETIRRVRAQKKELKARGKVDEILRDSWSERAVVSPAGPGAEEEDDEKEVDVDVVEEKEERRAEGKVPRDEVEMAHAKARAMSPPPPPAPAPIAVASPTKRPVGESRPTSPLHAKATGGVIPGVESADLLRLQGIDQRMALMKQLLERVKR